MLKENGAPPADGRWADIAVLEPVRDYKARHASTLLTFDAVVDAIDQIEAKREGLMRALLIGAAPTSYCASNSLIAACCAVRSASCIFRCSVGL